ncbi:MAG: HAD-IIB family hydrolase [Labilithrix sp.]|nr:HAD-IIB family hydrolase [Labilithrix sp.]MCW5815553.1 HAD-IIB family hydrolase [Labilithrix sp.]
MVRPLASLAREDVAGLRGVFFDLDDTLLTHGLLEREAYGALWDLHDAGIPLVAVTGRPSGWAEVFVRNWPIDGAVTENGAVFVVRAGKGASVITEEGFAERRARLDALVGAVREAMPDLVLSDDVRARRSDVTWDIGERVVVAEDRVAMLGRLVVAAGARTTRSTVHLHASYERDDKASGALRFARTRLGEDPGRVVSTWAFVGDSPNDAACFAALRLTFGVANVRPFVSKLSVPPRWIAAAERGAGFAEIARAILAKRGGRQGGSAS